MRVASRLLLFPTALLLACQLVVSAFGQAWVPPKGEGEMAISYQNLFTTEHFNGDGSRHDYGHIRLFGVIQEFDYGATDKFAVSLSVPYGFGKYHGPFPHLLPIDNGDYHGALQDLHVGFRYNVRAHPFMLTPFLAVAFPSHHYEHFAHSAVGTDLWEVQIGMNVGKRLAPLLPNAFLQMRYSYAMVQRVDGIRPNRSRIETQFGYFLTRRLSVQAIAASQITHSGLDFPEDFPSNSPTDERWRHHDQISTINFLNLGGGVSVALTPSLQVYSSLLTSVWGQNGHALRSGMSVGMSWGFRTPWARPRTQAATELQPLEVAAWRKKFTPPTQQPCH
ncbi:MAG: hypothetical protein DMG74_01165 [Acidobacteria bacterium]|nr:MAG: hypothetical protein DMG74_01165 [Acidobacteriota bacterium]